MEDDDTDIDQVISMLDNAIFKHNENVYILCAKANSMVALNSLNKSETYFIYKYLVLMQTEDYQEANAILDKAIKLCPSHVEVLFSSLQFPLFFFFFVLFHIIINFFIPRPTL